MTPPEPGDKEAAARVKVGNTALYQALKTHKLSVISTQLAPTGVGLAITDVFPGFLNRDYFESLGNISMRGVRLRPDLKG